MTLEHSIQDLPAEGTEATLLGDTATHRIELWDWPLRLFHWLLVTAVSFALVTGKVGGDWMVWHGRAGIAIVGLLAFRLIWGFVGSTHARFVHFVPTPTAIVHYLRGIWFGVGHNPLGALSVIALLTVLGFQAGSGLVSNDDIAFTGPLASLIAESRSLQLTNWHHQVGNGLLVLIGLHVAAIIGYRIVKKANLVPAMIHGQKDVPRHVPAPTPFRAWALVVAVAFGAAAAWGGSGVWLRESGDPELPTETQATAPAQPASATPAW